MATTADDISFDQGVNNANVSASSKDREPTAQEQADVKDWFKKLHESAEFDKEARIRYALDRRYARSQRTSFEVAVPVAQSYIDVLNSFLYAKDPDVDVLPSSMTEPPPQKEIMALVSQQIEAQGQQVMLKQQQLSQALQHLLGGGPAGTQLPPVPPNQATQPQLRTPPTQTGEDPDSVIQQKTAAILKPYQQRRDDAKQLAATLELIVVSLWKKAKLKEAMKPQVGSALTVGIGWIKAVWLERMGKDPEVERSINDIREQLARAANTKRELDEGSGDDDLLKARLEQELQALEARVDIVLARGFVVDFVPAQDIQVSTDCRDLSAYQDASWIEHHVYKPLSEAQTDCPDIAEKLKGAQPYYPVRPRKAAEVLESSAIDKDVDPAEAQSFRKGGEVGSTVADGEMFVCFREIWDRATGNVITLVDGLNCYAKAPYTPTPPTTRFYPFFQYQIGHVDGERHPRSLITRSEQMLDEYNRTRTGFAKHRRRAVPKTAFDSTTYSQQEISKLTAADTGEMVPLKSLKPGEPIANALAAIKYPAIDPALYDTTQIRAELEMIWGIQEALSSSIQTAKTATEAEIQQSGTNSRTGKMRDDLDCMLSDLAQYTAEVGLQMLTPEDVADIAGPWSLWPSSMTVEQMSALVTVQIHAGSTGKPDTTAQRQAWAAIMPVIQNAIKEVGQLRGSSPDEIADCIEALIVESVNRTGDRVDATQFLPDPPRTPPPPPQPPAPPPLELSALAGQQITALTAVLTDVRAGALSQPSAIALIQAAFPMVPQNLVTEMVTGSLPQPGDTPQQVDAPHATPIAPPGPPQGMLQGQGVPSSAQPPIPPIDTTRLPPLNHMSPMPMNPGDIPHVHQ